MNTAAALALLRAGRTDEQIARQLHTHARKISALRRNAGIPKLKAGLKPKVISAEDRYRATAQPTDDGHMEWPFNSNIRQPDGTRVNPARVAFRIRWGREPVGQVRPGCGHDGCVDPDHVEDQVMRQQYRAIFGRVA